MFLYLKVYFDWENLFDNTSIVISHDCLPSVYEVIQLLSTQYSSIPFFNGRLWRHTLSRQSNIIQHPISLIVTIKKVEATPKKHFKISNAEINKPFFFYNVYYPVTEREKELYPHPTSDDPENRARWVISGLLTVHFLTRLVHFLSSPIMSR